MKIYSSNTAVHVIVADASFGVSAGITTSVDITSVDIASVTDILSDSDSENVTPVDIASVTDILSDSDSENVTPVDIASVTAAVNGTCTVVALSIGENANNPATKIVADKMVGITILFMEYYMPKSYLALNIS